MTKIRGRHWTFIQRSPPGGVDLAKRSDLLEPQFGLGLDTAFQALFVAIALLTGLLLAHAAVQPRTAL